MTPFRFAVLLPLSLLTCPALAADLPVKAPAAPPSFSWTGFYIGGHVGGIWSHETRNTALPIAEVFSQNGSGWLGGGQIGFDYQFAPSWLAGVEARLSGVSLSKTSPSVVFPPSGYQTKGNWTGTATGRLGYVSGPWLFYGRGGFATTNVTFIGTTPGDYVSVGGTRSGWTAGAGIEYKIMRNISLGVEYNHADFGTKHYNGSSVGGIPLVSDVAFRTDDVLLRVNYRFGN